MRDMFRRIAVLLMSLCPMGLADGELTEETGTEQTETPAEPSADTPAELPETPEVTEVPETPAEPTEVPTEPTAAPAEPTEVPTEPTAAPAEPTEAPTDPTAEPETPGSPSEAAAAVQALLDALPSAEAVQAMSQEEQQAVYAQVQAAYDAYMALSDEDKAALPAAEGVFGALFDFFNSGIMTTAADIQSNVPYYNPQTRQTAYASAEVVTEGSTAWSVDNDTGGCYVVTGDVTIMELITVTGNVNLILGNGATLNAQQGIGLDSGATLTIWEQPQGTEGYAATGALNATASGSRQPGIGGNSCTVNIMGGTVTARGGPRAAGIGSQSANTGTIATVEIYSGTVTANGGEEGAGIGDGRDSIVRIHGGTVTATGYMNSAGIGGGSYTSSATVEIYGGTVTATGGTWGAGVGGGLNGGSVVTIKDGKVTGEGGEGAAGIGSGHNGSTTVQIDGGVVTGVTGEDSSGTPAAIGGGTGGSAKVTITGGTVTVTGSTGLPAIGGGYYVNGGVSSAEVVITGGSVKGTVNVQPTDGNGNNIYLIKVENVYGESVDVNGTTWNAVNHSAAEDGDSNLYLWLPGPRNVVTVAGGAAHTYIFDTEENAFKEGDGANYYDPASKETKFTEATALTGTEDVLTNGWYVLRGSAPIGTDVAVSGDVSLILTGGSQMDVERLNIADSGSLHIYGESGDTAKDGVLTAAAIGSDSSIIDSGKLTVSGGTVTVSGSVRVDTLTVDGGILTAGDELTAADSVEVSGGAVTANKLGIATEAGGITITGGSVKVKEMGKEPHDGKGQAVHLLVVPNSGKSVTVNGQPWNGTGHSDGNLYMYVPGKEATVSVDGGAVVTYTLDGASFSTKDAINYYDPTDKRTKQTDAAILRSVDTTWTSPWYVVQGSVEIQDRVTVSGSVNLILADGAALNVPNGISVLTGNSLTIWGQSENYATNGKLTASAYLAAAIGGDSNNVCGNITINGGVIEAAGSGDRSPGIGGYRLQYGGSITINGGVVTGRGGYDGAGIGGATNVTITGGTVNGHGGNDGAGIGGSYAVTGKVTITGGTVTADAGGSDGNGGAGIGSGAAGNVGEGNEVIITGGTVTATGSSEGAAIGGGYNGWGTVTISGGTVTATGSVSGADIGGGLKNGCTVTINGGTVTAGRLGAGDDGAWPNTSSVKITGGTITADRVNTGGRGMDVTIDGGSFKVGTPIAAHDSSGAAAAYLPVDNPTGGEVTFGGKAWNYKDHTALDGSDHTLYAWPSAAQVGEDGLLHVKTADGTETTYIQGSTRWVPASAYTKTEVTYHSPTGGDQTAEAMVLTDGDMNYLATGGWYAAKGEVTLTGRLYFRGSGDVNLILTDGATLNAPQGVGVGAGQHLIIWGQSGQTGKLTAYSSWSAIGGDTHAADVCGSITVNGGVITAKNTYGDSILCQNLTVNGGSVTVPQNDGWVGFSDDGYGIHCFGTAAINGGTVETHGLPGGGGGLNANNITVSGVLNAAANGEGHGLNAASIIISGGAVTAVTTGAEGGSGLNAASITISGGAVTASAESGKGLNATSWIHIDGGSVISSPAPNMPPVDSDGRELFCMVLPNPEGKAVTINGKAWNGTNHRAVDPGDGNLHAWAPTEWVDENDCITVKLGEAEAEPYTKNGDGFWVPASSLEAVPYYDPTAGEMKETGLLVKKLTSGTTELSDDGTGWYYAEGDVELVGNVNTLGHVNLILANGCHVTVNGTLETGSRDGNITIWGQSADYASNGALTVTRSDGDGIIASNGDLIINGGVVTVNGGNVGIRCLEYHFIIINGGLVTVNGGSIGIGNDYGHGITVEIHGGTVDVTGGRLGIGSSSDGDYTTINIDITGGLIHAKGGYAAVGTTRLGANVHITGGVMTFEGTGGGRSVSMSWGGGVVIDGGSVKFIGTLYCSWPVNSQGQEAYALTLENPDGGPVTISTSETESKVWDVPNHKALDGDTTLYAFVPCSGVLRVDMTVDGQEETRIYRVSDHSYWYVGNVSNVKYYDPSTGETKKTLAMELSGNNGILNGSDNWVSGSWFYVDKDLNLGDLQAASSTNLILTDGTTLDLSSCIVHYSSNSLTFWGQSPDYGSNGVMNINAAGGLGLGMDANVGPGRITINGGVVNVTNTGDVAIGCYAQNTNVGGVVTINGGIVTAKGATIGIGSMINETNVNVNGGTVRAEGGSLGIGNMDWGVNLTVNGGSVYAKGGDAGVSSSGTYNYNVITINGGAVEAEGVTTGIGAGPNGSANVTINGGTVTATATSGAGIQARGNDRYSGAITIDGGSVKVSGALGPFSRQPVNRAGEDVFLLQAENPEGKTITIDGRKWSPVNHSALDDTDLYAYVTKAEQMDVILAGSTTDEHRVYQFDEQRKIYTFLSTLLDGHYYDPKTGSDNTHQVIVVHDRVTELQGTGSTEGWYMISGTVSAGAIHIAGKVNLILEDGCQLSSANIIVTEGNSLTIWGQNADPSKDGSLTATAPGGRIVQAAIGGSSRYGLSAGPIIINGGRITATGGMESCGIGASQDGSASVTINGGLVNAKGGAGYHGIGNGTRNGGSLTITGGTITANGYGSENTVITGGSVKGRVNGQPTDGTQNVYLLTVPNPSGGPVTIGDKTWSPTSHAALESSDTTLYAYVPGRSLRVVVGGANKDYTFDPATNTFTCKADYDWDNGTWTWSENGRYATYTVPSVDSSKPGLTWQALASVKTETTATCDTPGSKTYTASVTVLGETKTAPDKTVVTAPATGHSWDFEGKTVKRTLSEDGRTVTVYCLNDSKHTQSARLDETENESAYQEPDCREGIPGQRVYDRTFTVDGTVYDYDTLTVPIPAEHDWGTWVEAASAEVGVTSARKCSRCGKEETSNHWHQWNLPDNSVQGDTDAVKWKLGQDGEYYVTVNVTCTEPDCTYHDEPMQVVIDAGEIHASQTKAPTCTVPGEVVYYVTLTLHQQDGPVSETYYSEPRTLPAAGHTWDAKFTFKLAPGDDLTPQESWAPGEYCTMTLTCSECKEQVSVPAESIEGVVTKEPTCDVTGEATVTATASYEGVTYESEPQPRVAPVTGHCWNSAVVTWTEADFAHADVTFTCANDPSHTETVTVDTTSRVITPATCMEPGRVEYTADATAQAEALNYAGGSVVFTHADSIPALGHDWDLDEVSVGIDGDRTTVTVYCKNDETHTQTVYTELKRVGSQKATCTKEGFEEYQMTFHVSGVEEEQTLVPMTYPVPKCPHTWGPWVKQDDGTFKRTCSVCGAEETEDHEHHYTFPAEAQWSIADNGDVISATVVLTCTDGEKETLVYSGDQITKKVITEATCEKPGEVEYTVTATVDGKSQTYTKRVTIPATGHIWVPEDTVTWEDDYSKATFTFECLECHEKRTEKVPATATEIIPAGCETQGVVLYSAETELEGTYASVQQSAAIPAIGHHDWDVLGEDFPLEYGVEGDFTTVTITCRSDPSHTMTVRATLELVEEKCEKATCDKAGKDVYRMTYTVDGETYTLGNEVEYTIPALGHLWDKDGKCTREGCDAADGPKGTWHLPGPDDTGRVRWSRPEPGMRPYLTVTAVCVDDDTGTVTGTQDIIVAGDDIQSEKGTDPTCTEPGTTKYSGTVTLDGGESVTYTYEIENRPPTGHWWHLSEDDIEWAPDGSKVTFHFHCRWSEDHKADVEAPVMQTVLQPATCTEPGEKLLSATAQLGGTTAAAQTTAEIPALGHDFHNGVCSRCGAKDPNYVPPTTAPAETSGKGGKGSGKALSPDAGDETALLPWTAMLLACAGALVLLSRRRRPDRRSR